MKTNQDFVQEREEQVKVPAMSERDKLIEALKHAPKFDVVYADPPWDINQKGKYGAMNAALFLWVPNGLLQEGLDVLKAWGFTYRGYYVWSKLHMGLGQYFRNATELMLLGTRGKMPVDFHGQQNYNSLPRQDHSHKPEELYAIIERLYQKRNYLELFARKRPSNPNWYIWGNEAEGGSDIVIPGYPVPLYSGRVNTNPTDPDSPDTVKEA